MSKEQRIHELKTWPQYFQKVKSGEKRFEIRKDDRGFLIGDILLLREWDNKADQYTGDEIKVEVTDMIFGGLFGVMEGYVLMTIKRLGLSKSAQDLVLTFCKTNQP